MSKATEYTALENAPVVVDAVAVPVPTDRVEVIAPATLPGGYELHCDFQGRPLVVRVPPEGVKQGQQFVADVIRHGGASAEGSGHRIPTGKWRDGLCDCFATGICHPMLWLACCCKPLAIGQVVTRMGLSATGKVIPQDRRAAYTSAFKVIACLFILYLAVDHTLSYVIMPYNADMNGTYDADGAAVPPNYENVPAWAWVALGIQYAVEIAFSVYLLVVLIRTRSFVRQRYSIPEQCCSGCEDCCCSFWLPCCTTLQIARHTADYDTYHAACCTETGLPHNAPLVV